MQPTGGGTTLVLRSREPSDEEWKEKQGITRMCSGLPDITQSAHSSVSEREETGGYLGLQERVNRTRQDVETDREDEDTDAKREVDRDRTIRTNNDAHNLETRIANLLLWGGVPRS